MRGLRVLAFVVACLCVAEASATNHKVKLTTTSAGAFFDLNIDGVGSSWLFWTDADAYYAPVTLQGRFDAAYGAGSIVVTRIGSYVTLEFVANGYQDRDVEITFNNNHNGANSIAIEVMTQGAPPTPAEITAVTVVGLAEQMQQMLFLAQSLCLTCGLILGGFLWRTIVVAVRIK